MRMRQVERMLDLMELFAVAREPLTLTEIARQLSMPKSSAFNLIDTLLARAILFETSPRAGYYPTRRLFTLMGDVMEGDTALRSVHEELERLAARSGETALLAARDPQNVSRVVYVDVVESEAPIRYFARIGDKRPIFTTSSGKAILTTYPKAQRRRILETLDYARHRPGTVGSADELEAVLAEAEERGWCEDHAEYTPDVMGLAVPLRLGDRRLGLAIAGPLYRMVDRRPQLAALLREAAGRITAG